MKKGRLGKQGGGVYSRRMGGRSVSRRLKFGDGEQEAVSIRSERCYLDKLDCVEYFRGQVSYLMGVSCSSTRWKVRRVLGSL
jgi:hypothetical protein